MDNLTDKDLQKIQLQLLHIKDDLDYLPKHYEWYARDKADRVTNCIKNHCFYNRHNHAWQELESMLLAPVSLTLSRTTAWGSPISPFRQLEEYIENLIEDKRAVGNLSLGFSDTRRCNPSNAAEPLLHHCQTLQLHTQWSRCQQYCQQPPGENSIWFCVILIKSSFMLSVS